MVQSRFAVGGGCETVSWAAAVACEAGCIRGSSAGACRACPGRTLLLARRPRWTETQPQQQPAQADSEAGATRCTHRQPTYADTNMLLQITSPVRSTSIGLLATAQAVTTLARVPATAAATSTAARNSLRRPTCGAERSPWSPQFPPTASFADPREAVVSPTDAPRGRGRGRGGRGGVGDVASAACPG